MHRKAGREEGERREGGDRREGKKGREGRDLKEGEEGSWLKDPATFMVLG